MAKLTPEIIDKIREIRAAGIKMSKISNVIYRDYGIKVSVSMISDIVNGYVHEDKGNFTEKDEKYINDLIDGNVFTAPLNLTRLMKFGFVEIYYREGVKSACNHYNNTVREGHFTIEVAEEIIQEVEGWINSKDVRGENEEWFTDLINKARTKK